MNNDYLDYLEHDLFKKREKWKNHKYLYIDKNGRYIYPEDLKNGAQAKVQNITSNAKKTVNKVTSKASKNVKKIEQTVKAAPQKVTSAMDDKKIKVVNAKKEVSEKLDSLISEKVFNKNSSKKKETNGISDTVKKSREALREMEKQALVVGVYKNDCQKNKEELDSYYSELKRFGYRTRQSGIKEKTPLHNKHLAKYAAAYYVFEEKTTLQDQLTVLQDISDTADQVERTKSFSSGQIKRLSVRIKKDMSDVDEMRKSAETKNSFLTPEDKEAIETFFWAYEDYNEGNYSRAYDQEYIESCLVDFLDIRDEYGDLDAFAYLYFRMYGEEIEK